MTDSAKIRDGISTGVEVLCFGGIAAVLGFTGWGLFWFALVWAVWNIVSPHLAIYINNHWRRRR